MNPNTYNTNDWFLPKHTGISLDVLAVNVGYLKIKLSTLQFITDKYCERWKGNLIFALNIKIIKKKGDLSFDYIHWCWEIFKFTESDVVQCFHKKSTEVE